MNILYCGDANVRDGVLVSALSLLANQGEPVDIRLLTAELATPKKQYRAIDSHFASCLDTLVRAERPGSSVTLVDGTDVFRAQPPMANLGTRFTPFCMLRLYADQVDGLSELHRVLYLDDDVLCNGYVGSMYRQDMGGAEIAGALDRYGSLVFHHEPRMRDYLNSGVLLMDMDRIRQTGLLERCRDLCAEKRMFMPDQSALNKLARGKRILPRRYNEQYKLRRDTVFQHFTTRFTATGTLTVKPWEVARVHDVLHLHAYDRVLERYQRLRPLFIGAPSERFDTAGRQSAPHGEGGWTAQEGGASQELDLIA